MVKSGHRESRLIHGQSVPGVMVTLNSPAITPGACPVKGLFTMSKSATAKRKPSLLESMFGPALTPGQLKKLKPLPPVPVFFAEQPTPSQFARWLAEEVIPFCRSAKAVEGVAVFVQTAHRWASGLCMAGKPAEQVGVASVAAGVSVLEELREWASGKTTIACLDAEPPPVASGRTDESVSLTGEEKALALLIQNPGWTDKRMATVVGVSRSTLYRWPKYVAAKRLMQGQGKAGRIERQRCGMNQDE